MYVLRLWVSVFCLFGIWSTSVTGQLTAFADSSDIEAVAAAKVELNMKMVLGENKSKTYVWKNVNLVKKLSDGVKVSWRSQDENIISTDGVVTRPEYGEGDRVVKVWATMTRGEAVSKDRFTLTVKDKLMPDGIAVEKALSRLTERKIKADNTSLDAVVSDLNLPTKGKNKVKIVWTSTDEAIIAADGAVTVPELGMGDQKVRLDARLSRGSRSENVSFIVTVIDRAETDEEILLQAERLLTPYKIKGSRNISLDGVVNDLSLPRRIGAGVRVEWASSNEDFIRSNGRVLRPRYNEGNKIVIMTANLRYKELSAQKKFEVLVTRIPATWPQAVMVAREELKLENLLGTNSNAENISSDLNLPFRARDGVAIAWSTSSPSVISAEGQLNLANLNQSSIEVELRARLSKGPYTVYKNFVVTVVQP